MKQYALDRPRDDDPAPVCGRPRGHPGWCVTEEAYQRDLRRWQEYQAALRKKTP